jgi:hypothetical protein
VVVVGACWAQAMPVMATGGTMATQALTINFVASPVERISKSPLIVGPLGPRRLMFMEGLDGAAMRLQGLREDAMFRL